MKLLLFFVFLIPTKVFCLINISGKVIDLQSNTPIEYANIYVQGTLKGTLSDRNGTFEISGLQLSDILVVSAIGYEELEIAIAELEGDLYLKPTVYNLAEVVIPSGNSTVEEYGFTRQKLKRKNISTLSHGLIWDGKNVSNTAAQAARHITNPDEKVGFIQSISFYIHSMGQPETPFRIRLIEMDENNRPWREMITENIVVQAAEGDSWLEVDLSKEKLLFPKNGFLVSMEWLQTNTRDFWYETTFKKIMKNNPVYEDWKSQNKNRNTFWGYGQIIGLYNSGETGSRCWRSDIQTPWYSFLNKSGELMIKAKIKTWE